jgi:methylated-DNA-[protein]-cysteine S-methyltransferase
VSGWTTSVDSPLGPLDLVADAAGALTHLLFREEPHVGEVDPELRVDPGPFSDVLTQLEEYFAGGRTRFDLPLAPRGTKFQLAAWAALNAIPYGETRTYGEQAAVLGQPSAVRAVGAANGRNPIGIVVPCHRVIGAGGSLTGYGGGISRKRWLLDHERGAGLFPATVTGGATAAAPQQR